MAELPDYTQHKEVVCVPRVFLTNCSHSCLKDAARRISKTSQCICLEKYGFKIIIELLKSKMGGYLTVW